MRIVRVRSIMADKHETSIKTRSFESAIATLKYITEHIFDLIFHNDAKELTIKIKISELNTTISYIKEDGQ